MDESYTVILSAPEVDALVAASLFGRATDGPAEALVYDSEKLLDFFGPSVQEKLPRGYALALCGLEVLHTDWDGQLVRPQLMDALRAFLGPISWLSARPWAPEDRSAVAHVIGEDNLLIARAGETLAGMLRRTRFGAEDEYEDSLARFTAGRLTPAEADEWGEKLRQVLTALKCDYARLAAAVAGLMEGSREELVENYAEEAARIQEDNRRCARESAEEPRPMGAMKLVCLSLSADKHPFWEEISCYSRQEKQAELSLCRLEGRPVMLLACDAALRANLRAWARYVTDLLPGARTLGAQPDVVPLVISGRGNAPGLPAEVLALMADGAHLLKD